MNLLYVTHSYPRTDGDLSGAFVERLAAALVRRGHAITVVAPADEGRAGRDERYGIAVHRIRYAAPSRETLAYRGTMAEQARSLGGAIAAVRLVRAQAAAIRRISRQQPIDLVHAHWWVPGGVAAWVAGVVTPLPYLVTLHGTDVWLLQTNRLARALAARVFRRAKAVTAVSTFLAAQAGRRTGVAEGIVTVQPMPVDVDRFAGTSDGGDGVAVLGRLTAQKNIALVFDALAYLRDRGRRVDLVVIGDGPDRHRLQERAVSLGLESQVRFVGAVEPARVGEAVGNADVMVCPGVAEGFGLAAVESLMLGVPVVALESGGGLLDIVPRKGAGRVVPPDDPAALARAIVELADDRTSRHSATRAGAEWRGRLSPDVVAEAFERVYEGAVAH